MHGPESTPHGGATELKDVVVDATIVVVVVVVIVVVVIGAPTTRRHSFHPDLATEESDLQKMLPTGVMPEGPTLPE